MGLEPRVTRVGSFLRRRQAWTSRRRSKTSCAETAKLERQLCSAPLRPSMIDLLLEAVGRELLAQKLGSDSNPRYPVKRYYGRLVYCCSPLLATPFT